MAETKVPSLPEIPNGIDGSLRKFLEAVRQVVNVREGLKGDALDANVTYRDLINAGIATSDSYVAPSNGGSPVDPAAVTDSTPLGLVTGVQVDAAVESVILSWDQISDSRFSHVEIWRGVSATREGIVAPIGTTTGSIFIDKTVSTSQAGGYYYWVRTISTSGSQGPFNVDAYRVTSTILPSTSLTAIKSLPQYKDMSGLPFYYLDANVTVNGVAIPKGTYMWTAVIADATIESAKIKNLSVDKLVAGNAAVATLTANTIAATMISSTSAYVKSANIESLAANKITAGTITAAISMSAPSILGGNITGGEIHVPDKVAPKFQVLADGSLYASKATIVGDITATSGTFSGTLNVKSAQTGARMEIKNNVIKVYDSAGTLRVQIGDLSV